MNVLRFPPLTPPVVSYAEASYFDGYHFHHIAALVEYRRLKRIERAARGRR